MATPLLAGAPPFSLQVIERHSLPHPTPLRIPEGMMWALDHLVAADPDGQHLWVLQPAFAAELKRRTEGQPLGRQLQFRLELLNLSTGEVVRSEEMLYDLCLPSPSLHFGFALAPNGEYLCTIRTDQVQVFNRELNLVAEFGAGLKSPEGMIEPARSCGFFPDTLDLLVTYLNTVIIYDWRNKRIVRAVPFESKVDAATALAGEQALVYHALRNWNYRQRVARVTLTATPPGTIWATHIYESATAEQHTTVSAGIVFRGECKWWAYQPIGETAVLVTRRPGADAGLDPYPNYPYFEGRIRSWQLDSGKKGPTFQLSGYLLHWPLTVSRDGRWLAVRATHYTEYGPEGEPLGCCVPMWWDDMRFVVFDVHGNSKRPVYISEDFGRDEAVIGLAFTPDGSTLIVVTTARLIIYDVNKTPMTK